MELGCEREPSVMTTTWAFRPRSPRRASRPPQPSVSSSEWGAKTTVDPKVRTVNAGSRGCCSGSFSSEWRVDGVSILESGGFFAGFRGRLESFPRLRQALRVGKGSERFAHFAQLAKGGVNFRAAFVQGRGRGGG